MLFLSFFFFSLYADRRAYFKNIVLSRERGEGEGGVIILQEPSAIDTPGVSGTCVHCYDRAILFYGLFFCAVAKKTITKRIIIATACIHLYGKIL